MPALESSHRQVEQVDIGEEMRLFLLPTNVLVASPSDIAPEVLQAFRNRQQQILLIYQRTHQCLLATLDELHDACLIAYTPQDTPADTLCDEQILVIFPASPRHHYVLKTRLENLHYNRWTLGYQNRRADVRFNTPVALPVSCTLAPPGLIAAFRYARVMREIITLDDSAEEERIGKVSDLIYDANSIAVSPLMQTFAESLTQSCSLHDISLGGVGLNIDDTCDLAPLEQRLVRLQMFLPHMTSVSLDQPSPGIFLSLLGVVRHISTATRPNRLHIQFLARLPEELNTCFSEVSQQLGGSY